MAKIGDLIESRENRVREKTIKTESKEKKGIDYSKVGRKKIADSQKKKSRAMMRYSDSDWNDIEKLAKIAGLKPTDWLRVAIQEKARKENIELS